MNRFLSFGCILLFTGFAFSAWSQVEPTNHVTGFSAITNSDSDITLSWTDAIGAQLPDFYLVVGRKLPGGVFAPVADGPEVAADADWTNGNFAAIVSFAGPNTLSVTGLTPESNYEFSIYSYQVLAGAADYKIGGQPTQTAFTFSTQPGGHSTTFTATLNGNVDIDLVFDAATTLTNADGYVIYRRPGSAALLGTLINGAAPPATLGGGTVRVYITNGTETTYTDAGLNGGVTYHYVLVPFNYDGTNNAAYNYRTDGSEPRANATTNLIISITQISGGVSNIATSPLNSGSTNQAILGFSITTNGPTTFNALNVSVSSTPIGKFLNPRIFKSADGSFGGDASINSGSLSATQLQFTTVGDAVPAGITNYFIVINVNTSVNGTTPAILPSFTQANMTFTNPAGAAQAVSVTGINYSFVDTSPPSLTFNPLNLATNVSVAGNIIITFDEPIRNLDDSPITSGDLSTLVELKLTNDLGVAVPFTATIDGTNTIVTIDPSATLLSSQLYYVEMNPMEDALNNATSAQSLTFTTEAPPIITGYSANPTCMGETINITGTGFGATVPTVTVNGIGVVPSVNTPTSITIVVPTTTAGATTVIVTNTTNSLNDTDNTLTLKDAVAASLPLSSNPPVPVVSQNYNIQVANTQLGVSYRVRELPTAFGGGFTAGTGGTISLTPAYNKGSAGNFQYEVQTQSAGCTQRVYGPLAVTIADLLANAGPDKVICAGDTISIGGNPTALGGTGFHQITWNSTPADPSLSGQTTFSNPLVSPTVTTTYHVTVDDSSPAVPAMDDIVVTVNQPNPQSDLAIQLNPTKANNTYQKTDGPVELKYTLMGVPGIFVGETKFVGPGVNSTGSQKYFYPEAGNVGSNEIILQYQNPVGCITSDTVIVFVRDNNIFMPTLANQYCEGAVANNLTIQSPITYPPFKFDFGFFGVFYFPGYRYTYIPINVNLYNSSTGAYVTTPGAFSGTATTVNLNTGLAGPGKMQFELLYNIQVLKYNDIDPLNPIVVGSSNEYIAVPFEIIAKPTLINRMPTATCENDPAFTLDISPSGGSFFLNGSAGSSTFNPGTVGLPDNNTIVYTYMDPATSCSNSVTHMLTINRLPGADIDFQNGCQNELIDFTSVFINPTNIDFSYTLDLDLQKVFNFPNNSPQTEQNVYSTPSNYAIKLNLRTAAGCTKAVNKTLTIGEIPDLATRWYSVCDGDPTRFAIKSNFFNTKLNQVDSILWDFGDTQTTFKKTPTFPDSVTTHLYAQTGSFQAIAGLVTTLGCRVYDTLSIYKVVKDSAKAASPYLEDFNGTFVQQGWIAGGKSSSWAWGSPADVLINSDASGGGKAWVTNLTGPYNANEKSWVHSPCFDLIGLQRPVLGFDRRLLTGPEDGTVLQVNTSTSTNGNTGWQTVGFIGEGINWYNSQAILGAPGGHVAFGWEGSLSADSTEWRRSIIALDDYLPPPNDPARQKVRFRIAFGSDGAVPGNEGFAFDNFEINQRSRVVLVEQFTNNGSSDASSNELNKKSNIQVNQFINLPKTTNEIVKIEYHLGFAGPNVDLLYSDNQQDASARAAFYGIINTPYTLMDAFHQSGDFYNPPSAGWGQAVFSDLSLLSGKVTIDTIFCTNTPADKLNIEVAFTVQKNLPANTVIQIVVVERDINSVTGTNGENRFTYVMKKMLPNATGTRYEMPLPVGFSDVINVSWSPKAYNIDSLSIVAFAQNEDTKEIYQASFLKTPQYLPPINIITATEDPQYAEKINLYPNPANREVNIELPSAVNKPTPVALFDAFGRTIYQAEFKAGERTKTISTDNLVNGVYMLQIITPQGSKAVRKVLVKH